MKTETIKVTYSLTDEVYRANVRAASGPTPKVLEAVIPVGELTPEGREALLEIPHGTWGYPAAEAVDYPVTCGTPVAEAPTAALVSAELVRRAEKVKAEKAEKAEKENAERERAEAIHAARVAELTGLLDMLDAEFAEVRDSKAARRAAEKLPGEYGSPNELTSPLPPRDSRTLGSGRCVSISSADDDAWWYVTAHVGAKSYTASHHSLAIAIREAIRGAR